MKLVPIEEASMKSVETRAAKTIDKMSKEDEVMNIAKSNLDDNLKKNILKSLYGDEMKNNSEKLKKPEPKITSLKLLTPPPSSKKRKSTKSKNLTDPFESVKWTPY